MAGWSAQNLQRAVQKCIVPTQCTSSPTSQTWPTGFNSTSDGKNLKVTKWGK